MYSSLAGLLVAGFANLALAADPTFAFGPASDYRKAPAVTASPTGNDLQITPTDASNAIPPDGVDFFLGPELQESLKKTIDGVCANDIRSKECTDALSVALDQDKQLSKEKRFICGGVCLGAVLGYAVSVGLGLAWMAFKEPEPQPVLSHFHLASSEIVQLSSITGTTAVFATATEATDHITFTLAPTTVTDAAEITTLTTDQAGHQSGDVLIALPTEPAGRVGEILARAADGFCNPRSEVKRADDVVNYMGVAKLAEFGLRSVSLETLRELGFSARDSLPGVTEDSDSEQRMWYENPFFGIVYQVDITIGIKWIYGDENCPTLDLTSEGAMEMCKDRVYSIIHNCDTSNREGADRWKAGGE